MIQINDLNFAYPRQEALFSDLTMQLEAGSITGLLGKNGAGKTSLLKLLAGLLFPLNRERYLFLITTHVKERYLC